MTEPRPAADRRRVLLGEITGAHGVRGSVVLKVYTADPRSIAAYGPLADEAGRASFTITVERVTPKGAVIARVKEVTDRNAAEKLRGVKLYADRDRLPKPAEGEYYHADLIGLAAVGPDGTGLGDVVAVVNYGAGDLLEIRLAGTKRTELVAMTEANIKEVDIASDRIVVSMPVETSANDDPDGP